MAAAVRKIFTQMFPREKPEILDTLFDDVDTLFSGRHPDYHRNDLRYHDLEHTLQVTWCFARLMAGRQQAAVAPHMVARQFELGIASALLHDTGYLKLRSDTAGTGAKYTYIHVLRSCALAASYLPTIGANTLEIDAVLAAISCTGPTTEVARLHFNDPMDRIIGCAVATADYLAQMAAPDYPDELALLYSEFEESDDFIHTPRSERMFKSAEELIERTPEFWSEFVQPRLETNLQALYRFLAEPYPHGANSYLDDIERNIAIIRRRLAARGRKIERLVR